MFAGWKELTIVTPSQWLADRVRGSFLNKHRAIVICNGVDTDIFHPRDCEALRRRYGLTTESVVLAVAPDIMSEQKGEKWILELTKSMKEFPVCFIMIGFQREELSKIEFPENVLPIIHTEDQVELAQYYSLADAFVICSCRETFSMTCAEALCCGTSVVGFT